MLILGAEEIRARLTYEICIPVVRAAMVAVSKGETRQVLRTIMPLADDRMFGIMPGALSDRGVFGAKLVSVMPHAAALGRSSHQGLVVLFDPEKGGPVCLADAGEVTAIRTAAATAVATDALAQPGAERLAILGYGEQAAAHVRALARVRPLGSLRIWGRDSKRAAAFADTVAAELKIGDCVAVSDARSAVADAQIVCTLTSSPEPILQGAWLPPGVHVNVVGSSYAGPSEVDHDLVVRSRFIADSRLSVLAQGAEFLRAKAAGLIGDDHIAGEIGQVISGEIEGRQSPTQRTVYKSLGHIAQDLAATHWLYQSSTREQPR